MITHEFQGETFRVAKGLSVSERDAACAILVAYKGRAKGEKGETYFEVDRMPEGAVSVPKTRGRKPRVSAPISTGEPVEGHTVASDATPDEAIVYSESETRYAQGFYRVPCAECGKPIPLTGKRGRAPKYHTECRPTD